MKLFPEDTLRRFEYTEVIRRVTDLAQSRKAKNYAESLEPVDEPSLIGLWLNQTSECLNIVENGIFFPDYAFPNISHELGKLGVQNAVLEGSEAINLRKIAEVAATVIRFFKEKSGLYPALKDITIGLNESKDLIKHIDAVLEPNGFVRSNASKELQSIRKELSEVRQKANKAFEAALRKYKKLGWLREFDESFYNDRRVLAVLAEHKRQIPGTLHGTSETGSTAFIEPAQMVPLNNDVAEAMQREKREEYRILRTLTDNLRGYRGLLESYESALGFLDFTFAKARFALSIGAGRPILSDDRSIELIDAQHPILLLQNRKEGKTTVPLSLRLDTRRRILIISGPNAGGKSISLKTLGLLQLMFQSGMLIPAAEHSRMTVFKQIFVDIGDDQSIAYELSTYSSRLIKMKHFLMQAHKHTLFFIDEFGTGSDPELGGAIAGVILEELAKTRALGIITTHYANIKIMAEKHPNLLNGCMLFDEESLQPKYHLETGHAGSSYTFEVARKIGLEPDLIERAKAKIDDKKVKFDQLLITLQTKKNALNKETHMLQAEKGRIKREIDAYQREAETFKQKQEDLNFGENKQLIEKGKKYDSLIEAWQDKARRKELAHKLTLQAEKEASRKKEADVAGKLREKQERIRRQKANKRNRKQEDKKQAEKPVLPGSKVKLRDSRQEGVVEDVNRGKATVVFGMVRTIVPVDKLLVTD